MIKRFLSKFSSSNEKSKGNSELFFRDLCCLEQPVEVSGKLLDLNLGFFYARSDEPALKIETFDLQGKKNKVIFYGEMGAGATWKLTIWGKNDKSKICEKLNCNFEILIFEHEKKGKTFHPNR